MIFTVRLFPQHEFYIIYIYRYTYDTSNYSLNFYMFKGEENCEKNTNLVLRFPQSWPDIYIC